MVDRELRIPASDSVQRAGHRGSVVDHHLQRPTRGNELLGELPQRVDICQIRVAHAHSVTELGESCPRDIRSASRDDDVCPSGDEGAGDLDTQAGVAAGENRRLPTQIRAVDDVSDPGVVPEAGAQRTLSCQCHWGEAFRRLKFQVKTVSGVGQLAARCLLCIHRATTPARLRTP